MNTLIERVAVAILLSLPVLAAPIASPAVAAPPALLSPQIPFERVVEQLANRDKAMRLQAVRMLKDAGYPESAVPLAPAVVDADDEVQLEAIAAELNIFLAERIAPRRRVGLVVEVRNRIAAEAAFSRGPLALLSRPVPPVVLDALRRAARDANPQVALEALYAFGTLAVEPSGSRRRELLRPIGPDLASMVGAANVRFRHAAVRVIGRVYERRREDELVDNTIGDAMVSVLNDRDQSVRADAMRALGSMKYERGVQALVDQFRYFGRGQLAEAALDGIARIAHPSSTPLLIAQLTSKEPALKTIAIEGVARLGDKSRLATIESALKGENNDGVLLAGRFASIVLSSGLMDPMADALRRPKFAARAREYLVEIAPGRSSVFRRYAQDPDAHIRSGMADVLGLAGDVAALSILEPMRRDSDPQVAQAAERAVARLNALRS